MREMGEAECKIPDETWYWYVLVSVVAGPWCGRGMVKENTVNWHPIY